MSMCKKGIEATNILNMTLYDIDKTLDHCEQNCDRYYQCDTIAYMSDISQVIQGTKLICPYCKRILGDNDFSDLLGDYSPQSQVELLHELWDKGYNIVTCGNCGEVFIHRR